MRSETFVYKVVGGCALHADVYQPDGELVRPVLVWIHGGALIMGSRTAINPAQRARYLDAGLTVVAIDYRLAPETRLPAIVEDVHDAFAWLRSEGPSLFPIDPDRVAVVGHSAGGYLALLSGGSVAPRPRAIVSFYGYGDIVGDWYRLPDPFYCRQPRVSEDGARAAVGDHPLSGADGPASRTRSPFYLWCRQQGRWPREVVGSDPDTEPEAFDPFRPVWHVTPDYPPTLLLHGDQDTDVPHAQSVLMDDALAKAGVEHELLTVRGGGHGFDRDLDQPAVAHAFDHTLAFLRRHIGTAPPLAR